MPTYETIFALPSVISEEEQSQSVKEIEELIGGFGGNITLSEDMGEKRMAYKVRGYERAFYHIIKFDSPPESIEGFKRFYKINGGKYIRNMIVRTE